MKLNAQNLSITSVIVDNINIFYIGYPEHESLVEFSCS